MGSLISHPEPLLKDPAVYAERADHIYSKTPEKVYDYVLVGGGTAACVLAHRLTEAPDVSVLMIEAGGSNKNILFNRMPATFAKNFKTKIDWIYNTTNQEHANNRSYYWPAGKVLGGASSINAMLYQRPCADDAQEWVKLGAIGWDWNNFKGYLDKAEKYTLHPKRPNNNSSHRGTSGYWLTKHPEHFPIAEKFIDACEHVGIPRIDDTCGPSGPIGATFISGFVDQKGQRSSTATAYLTPAVLARPNLTVAIETTVTKILFSMSSGTPRAVGVEIATSPETPRYRVAARREVLCCAGAIRTPQILTLSGIGPKDDLERLNVPIVKELDAVGKNLCDHLVTPVAFRAKHGTTMDPLITPTGGLLPLARWLITRGGPFAMLVGQAWAFVKSTDDILLYGLKTDSVSLKPIDFSSGPKGADLEFLLAPAAYRSHGFIPAPSGTSICTIAPVLLRPQSTGSIALKSNSIWDKPDINPNYFQDRNDLDTLVRGVRLALRIARSEPLLNQLLLKVDAEESEDLFFPGDANPDKISDDALRRWILRTSETIYHPMCTARIGQSAADSVVNHELRVHGVSGLRVIDASVLPSPFAGHPCCVVVGIAEKAADMIKGTTY